jgi:hypothetical protein
MFTVAKSILEANKQFCIEEAMAYVAAMTTAQAPEFVEFPQTPTSIDFCRRDITFVIEAYISGLVTVDSKAINFVSSRYWIGKKSALVGNKAKEVSTHTFLRDLIVNYVLKNIHYPSKQTVAQQVTSYGVSETLALVKIVDDCNLLVDVIQTGPKQLYLHNHLETRYTAKWWDPKPVEQTKLETILECAYQAPSKQGHHDFEIVVLTDSVEGQAFKQWLYWEDTACLNKVRAAPGQGLRRYNGQVLAPIVMIWLAKKYPASPNPYGESEWLRTNNDCIISSTMAMCQAEELGMDTGFCGTLGVTEIPARLNKLDRVAVISVGFGYATPDNQILRKVYKDGVEMGFDLSNTNPLIRTGDNRKNRPPKYSMINYI